MTFKVKSGIRVNTVDVIDQYGNFTGNAFLGSTPVAIDRGGTNAADEANARINLFNDVPAGLVVQTGVGVTSTSIIAGSGIDVQDGDGVSGNPTISLDANADVTFANITVTGILFSNDITASHITADGDLIVTGNLIVEGNVTTLNTEDVFVEKNEIVLNANVSGTPVLDAYITVNRGEEPSANLKWNEDIDRWQFTNDGEDYYNIPVPEEYDNVVYTVSVEESDTPDNGANIRLTGTKGLDGNVYLTDDIKLLGAGLVTVTRQDADTVLITAGGSLYTTVENINDLEANILDLSDITVYRSKEYFYTATSTSGGTKFASGKILVLHDGTVTYNNQFAMLQSDPENEVVVFTTDISNGNVRLLAQATTGLEAKVTLTATSKTPV
jgi:hypothetical protein